MSHRRHVLIAMKEHALRRILAGALRSAGHVVVEAFSDTDMMTEISSAATPFDAVVRDGRRDPECVLDGLVRLRAADSHLPVCILVNRATPSFAMEAHRLGATLLGLPLTAAELRAAITGSERPVPLTSIYAAGADHHASAYAAPRP